MSFSEDYYMAAQFSDPAWGSIQKEDLNKLSGTQKYEDEVARNGQGIRPSNETAVLATALHEIYVQGREKFNDKRAVKIAFWQQWDVPQQTWLYLAALVDEQTKQVISSSKIRAITWKDDDYGTFGHFVIALNNRCKPKSEPEEYNPKGLRTTYDK